MSANQDAFCEQLLATKEHREARDWLAAAPAGTRRTIGEQGPTESRAIVEDLYGLGALDVQAVEFCRDPAFGETTNSLVVTLPDHRPTRTELLRYEARHARAHGFDPVGDYGQRYLFLYKFKLSLGQLLKGFFKHGR